MRNHRVVLALVVLAASPACGTERYTVPESPPGAATAAVPGPGPTICADMGELIAAARKNFPDLRRQDKPVVVDHVPGFEATVVLPNTVACRILTSTPPYPDAYECDLAPVESLLVPDP